MRNILLVGAALGLLVSPAAADFFVVQDTSTKRCTIAQNKPSGNNVLVAGTKTYGTREEAQAAMDQSAACKADARANEKTTPPSEKGAAKGEKAAPKGQVRLLAQSPAGSWSITRLYKQAVYNGNNERIGEVDDVLVTNEGRAVALVIGVGGFLGIGETHVLVPFDAIRVSDSDGSTRLVMNSSREELRGATHYRYDRTKFVWVVEGKRDTGGKAPATKSSPGKSAPADNR